MNRSTQLRSPDILCIIQYQAPPKNPCFISTLIPNSHNITSPSHSQYRSTRLNPSFMSLVSLCGFPSPVCFWLMAKPCQSPPTFLKGTLSADLANSFWPTFTSPWLIKDLSQGVLNIEGTWWNPTTANDPPITWIADTRYTELNQGHTLSNWVELWPQ